MKKVLVINAHQFYEGFAEGKLNKTMTDVIMETAIPEAKQSNYL